MEQAHDWKRAPVFCVTVDVDWASEDAIAVCLAGLASRSIVPTVFVTHASPVLAGAAERGEVELGLHPNFLPGSSHGATPAAVLDHLRELVPAARCFRSHAYVENAMIMAELAERGMLYDSNLCLQGQPDIVPLRHWTGIWRFPVFWEDDVHWRLNHPWDIGSYRDPLLTPGLKIFDIHPIHYALNTPSDEFYAAHKHLLPSIGAEELARLRHPGRGCADLFHEMLALGRDRGCRFARLSELFAGLQADRA